nr:hypothetical protein [candidate division Zixibacteria bacterium]
MSDQNTNDRLEELALELSSKTIEEALICANSMEKLVDEYDDLGGPTSETYRQLIMEFIYLYVHLGHRWSFETHGAVDADKFAINLESGIRKILAMIKEDDASEIIARLRTAAFEYDPGKYYQRNLEYSRYLKLLPDSDDDPETRGKLLWEFGAGISAMVAGHEKDARIIIPCVDWTIESLNNMLIRKRLQQLIEN